MRPRLLSLFYNNPDKYPPIINGTRLLARAGVAVEIICRDDGERLEIAYPSDAVVNRVGRGTGWRGYANFVAAAFRRGPSATIFAAHDIHALLPATILARLYRRPLIYHVHDYVDMAPALPMMLRMLRAFQHRMARSADAVTIPDAGLGDIMVRELGLGSPPLVVANGPLTRFSRSRGQLAMALGDAGYRFDKIVLRQGRIGPGHAIETTLESMGRWRNPNWGFVLIGIGDRDYLGKTRAMADALGVGQRLAILPPVPYDAIGSFTVGADLGHAIYEPITVNHANITGSNKIREYMAAGIPLVVADNPSLRAMMARYRCGLVADEGSPESIAEAVNTILTDPALARRMGDAGARAFEAELTFERQFAPVLSRYLELIQTRSR